MVHYQYDETLVQETVQNPYQTPENARIYFLSIYLRTIKIRSILDAKLITYGNKAVRSPPFPFIIRILLSESIWHFQCLA